MHAGPYRRGVQHPPPPPPSSLYYAIFGKFDLIRKFLLSYEVLRSNEIDLGNVIEKWAKQRARRIKLCYDILLMIIIQIF